MNNLIAIFSFNVPINFDRGLPDTPKLRDAHSLPKHSTPEKRRVSIHKGYECHRRIYC